VVSLQHTENSNAEVVILGSVQDYYIFPTSVMILSFFSALTLLVTTSIAVDVFCAESHVFLAGNFIGCFMKPFSCDYVGTLKHTESSNGEVIIQGSAQNNIFFHISISNLHDN
jgi:ABC-type multidrug transport system permease subunit